MRTAFMSCTLVILLISAIQCQQNPTISFITKERITSIGDTLDISCSVQYAKNYPVIWAKFDPDNPRNTLFISKGASLSIPDNRYSVRHDDASSTYTLQITKIQEVDAGIYQCMVVISTSSRVTASKLLSYFYHIYIYIFECNVRFRIVSNNRCQCLC